MTGQRGGNAPAAALVALVAAASGGTSASALDGTGAAPPSEAGGHDFSFAVVPGPVYNPSPGWGLMVIPMAMYDVDPDDDVSPGSTTAAFGLATSNGSWALGPAWDELGPADWLPSGGVGQAIPDRRMNARFDVAWGKEGANFCFSVGEAF